LRLSDLVGDFASDERAGAGTGTPKCAPPSGIVVASEDDAAECDDDGSRLWWWFPPSPQPMSFSLAEAVGEVAGRYR